MTLMASDHLGCQHKQTIFVTKDIWQCSIVNFCPLGRIGWNGPNKLLAPNHRQLLWVAHSPGILSHTKQRNITIKLPTVIFKVRIHIVPYDPSYYAREPLIMPVAPPSKQIAPCLEVKHISIHRRFYTSTSIVEIFGAVKNFAYLRYSAFTLL